MSKITDTISPKTLLSWNSLRHVELIMAIEQSYNVMFSTPEIISLTSFAGVRDMLLRKGAVV